MTRLWDAEERLVGERNRVFSVETVRAQKAAGRESRLMPGLGELRNASMKDKRGNGHSVEGKQERVAPQRQWNREAN